MAEHFVTDGSLRPGWDWFPGSTPVATSNECSESPNGAIRISECYWFMAHVPSSTAARKTDAVTVWIAEKQRKTGTTKACVAVANKNARIIWALLAEMSPTAQRPRFS